MADIRHRVGIAAPVEQVYEAVATVDGLNKWWSSDLTGSADLGGTLRFFGDGVAMDVVAQEPVRRVDWLCSRGPADWLNTKISFEVAPGEGEAVLLFAHSDWQQPTPFHYHCSTKWAVMLVGLKNWLEGGDPRPFPNDPKITRSPWG